MSRIRQHLTYANVISTLCLFLLLGGGSAVALSGVNTVFTDDIVNDQVKSADVRNDDLPNGGLAALDLRAGSVRGPEVLDNSLSGADIAESTLRRVPSALTAPLGGRGRGGPVQDTCNPDVGAGFETCATVELTIPPPGARVLVLGAVRAIRGSSEGGDGSCQLSTSSVGTVPDTNMPVILIPDDVFEIVTLVGVAPLMSPGSHSFRIECNETDSDRVIDFDQASVQAVALSPG